ncbi:MAG: hemolysin family protein [Spirochaetaceae bacterium]|jgi:putative hemolysin|nr:hemolysin family protein [Spirochaetaceae bacterium]
MNDSPPQDPLLCQLLLQMVLIMLNAVFASAEIALISLNEAKLEKRAKDGNKNAKRLLSLTKQPEKFLATIQVGITIAGFLGSAFAADNFSNKLVMFLSRAKLPFTDSALKTISLVLITILLSFVTIVFGELVPKRVAMKKAEHLAYLMSIFILIISKLFYPAVWLLSRTSNAVLFILGIDPNNTGSSVTEEEIRLMVDAGSRQGVIEQNEKEIIQNVFEFDNSSASDFMTHRLDTVILFLRDNDEVWRKTIINNPYNHYPVCGNTADDIVGVLSTRDYLLLNDHTRANVMKNAVHEALFVPESLKADLLFKKMKSGHDSFALVIDEYGGFTGIITMYNLLGAIVGSIDDSVDGAPLIEKSPAGEWFVNGAAPLDKLAAALDVRLPVDQYDTFAGLVLGILGKVPEDGEQTELEFADLVIKILEVKDHRLERGLVVKKDAAGNPG